MFSFRIDQLFFFSCTDFMKTYQRLLTEKLLELKKKNSQFSLRSFSKSIKISPSQVSSLLSGRKKLTIKQASKIIEFLNLDETESQLLLQDLLPANMKSQPTLSQQKILSQDEFDLISDWYHFAILSLGQIKNHEATAKWIAHRLRIDILTASAALKRLLRLKLIEIKNNQLRQISEPLTTTTNIPSKAIRSYHSQNLQLAQEKLEVVPVEERLFSTITMATTPEKLKKVEKMINDFKHKICHELECNEPTDVYTLAIQLFPVTK